MLNVRNLAKVNNASLKGGGSDAPPAESWWQLIIDKQLLFRITCCIEADHASIGRRYSPAESGSTSYSRAQWMRMDAEECWLWPGSAFADATSTEAVNISGWSATATAASMSQTPMDLARRRFDAVAHARMPVSISGIVTSLERYKLGQRVWGIRGRNISFDTGGGRYPEVVGLTYHLDAQQHVEVVLDDRRFEGIQYDQRIVKSTGMVGGNRGTA
jgi:hypothetical protein